MKFIIEKQHIFDLPGIMGLQGDSGFVCCHQSEKGSIKIKKSLEHHVVLPPESAVLKGRSAALNPPAWQSLRVSGYIDSRLVRVERLKDFKIENFKKAVIDRGKILEKKAVVAAVSQVRVIIWLRLERL